MIDIAAQLFVKSVGGPFGRMGPVVKDIMSNQLLVLSSRDLIGLAKEFYVKMKEGRVKVGSRRNHFFVPGGEVGSAAGLAAWYAPDRRSTIRRTGIQEAEVAEERGLLSSKVAIYGDDEGPEGFVSRTNWFAKLSVEDRPASLFTGLIRVSSTDPDRAFAPPGTSGALVVSEEGKLVGLIVGAYEGDALVVPLQRILDSSDTVIASAADIASHNLRADAISPHEVRFEAFLESLGTERTGPDSAADRIHRWLETGWGKRMQNDGEAFSPYQDHFRDLHDFPDNISECLYGLAAEQRIVAMQPSRSSEALDRALLMFLDAHGVFILEQDEPKTGPVGSHDQVILRQSDLEAA